MAKQNDPRRQERRVFWFSFSISFFVFLTALGFLVVDYQGRKLSFGDSAPPIALDRQSDPPRLRVKAFGIEEDFDATPLHKALDFLCDFGCLPHR